MVEPKLPVQDQDGNTPDIEKDIPGDPQPPR